MSPDIRCLALALAVAVGSSGTALAEGFKKKGCGQELQEKYEAFKAKMSALNKNSHGDTAHRDKMTAYLTKSNAEVVDHEKAHKRVAGKWGSPPRFMYYTYFGKKYAVAGCVELNPNMPLQTRIDAALAPSDPSSQDKEAAAEAQRYLYIKKERDKCRKKTASKRNECLKEYADYSWLDRMKVK